MLFLLACAGEPGLPGAGDDTAAITGTTSTWTEGLAPLTALSDGECPDLADGQSKFSSNGRERKVRLYLPAEPTTAVFVWHPLGVSARQIADYMDLEALAAQSDVAFVVPEAKDDNPFEWDFWNGLDDDLVMFDDLRTCLVDGLGVDPGRIGSHGMSAGGLMTTFLSMERGDSLATVSVFSGGTEPVIPWEAPAHAFPALVVYGGEGDTYGSGATQIRFEETTLNYVDELRAAGHFVVLCDHGGGHTLPPETGDMLMAWHPAHQFGDASPFSTDISALPAFDG
jgi:hypothetical protein